MNLTIRSKLVLSSTVVFGAMLALFAGLIYYATRDAEITALDARLESQADKVATEIEARVEGGYLGVARGVKNKPGEESEHCPEHNGGGKDEF